jgi:hypothetical protein
MIEPRLLNFINALIKILTWFASFLLVIILIYLGILYITSSQEGVKKVHSRWYLILIGILLIFLPVAIINLISLFFNFSTIIKFQ